MAAEHRYVVGFRGCIGAASRCAWNMRLAVDHVITVTDENPDSVARLQDISDKDCLLMYSYTRIYRLDKNIIELAHGRGAKICLITNSTVSPMIKYADIVLYVETETPSFFHSTMAITMLSEYLVIGMAQKCNGAYKERLKERDSATGYMRL